MASQISDRQELMHVLLIGIAAIKLFRDTIQKFLKGTDRTLFKGGSEFKTIRNPETIRDSEPQAGRQIKEERAERNVAFFLILATK
jgi:hypothetical protein